MVFRKPNAVGHYSVEIIFDFVCRHLKEFNLIERFMLPVHGTRPWVILKNLFYVARLKNPVIHLTGDANYAILFCRNKKTILTILDCGFLKGPKTIKWWILYWLWLKLPVAKADYITAISGATADEISAYTGCPRDRIRVVPVFTPKSFPFEPRFKPSERKNILVVGNAPNKNVDRFIEAVKGLKVSMRIIGKLRSSQIEMLTTYDVSYDNIVRATEEELAESYARADLLLFASTLEGFGMPIVEAQMQGLPVVTSDCSSMPYVAGDGAFFVDPTSVEDIRLGIEKVMNDEELRRSLIESGQKNAVRFQPETVSKLYLDLYHEVLELGKNDSAENSLAENPLEVRKEI